MTRFNAPTLVLITAATMALGGCGRDAPAPPDPPAQQSDSFITRTVQAAMQRAVTTMEKENIAIGGKGPTPVNFGDSTADLPRAEITPEGDLLVEGKRVQLDEEQRQLLLAYRKEIVEVAKAGVAIGMQGADLGLQAAKGALKAAFTGGTDEFEQRMEAEGKKIEAQAEALICARMPGLYASQQAVAARVPEFRPYAKLDQDQVDNCGKDGHVANAPTLTLSDLDLGDDHGADANGTSDTSEGSDPASEADQAARGASRQ